MAVPTLLYDSDTDTKNNNNKDIEMHAAEMRFLRIVIRCIELCRKEFDIQRTMRLDICL